MLYLHGKQEVSNRIYPNGIPASVGACRLLGTFMDLCEESSKSTGVEPLKTSILLRKLVSRSWLGQNEVRTAISNAPELFIVDKNSDECRANLDTPEAIQKWKDIYAFFNNPLHDHSVYTEDIVALRMQQRTLEQEKPWAETAVPPPSSGPTEIT